MASFEFKLTYTCSSIEVAQSRIESWNSLKNKDKRIFMTFDQGSLQLEASTTEEVRNFDRFDGRIFHLEGCSSETLLNEIEENIIQDSTALFFLISPLESSFISVLKSKGFKNIIVVEDLVQPSFLEEILKKMIYARQKIYEPELCARSDLVDILKEQGNVALNNLRYNEAVERYTEALNHSTTAMDKDVRAVLYSNRALALLKLKNFAAAEADSTRALEYNGADEKALYRRALAREQLDNIGSAYNDAKEALRLQPKELAVRDVYRRLVKLNELMEMNKLAFEVQARDVEQKETAINNLICLAREDELIASRVWNEGKIVPAVFQIIDDKSSTMKLAITAVKILDEIVKNHKRALYFLQMHDTDGLKSVGVVCCLMCRRPAKEFVDAAGLIVQRMFNAMAKMDRQKEMKPDPEVSEANKLWIDRVILQLQQMLTKNTVQAYVRKTVIHLFLKNLMHMDGGIPRGWSWKFVEERGLLTLLDVSSQIPEQCDYPVTAETRQHLAICLQRLDEDMVSNTKRTIFKEKVDLFFNNLMARASDDAEGHKIRIKLASFLLTMLQGPVDIGINLVTNDQVTTLTIQMASSEDLLVQSIAAELIVMMVSKHERDTTMLKVGVPVLRKLYDSEHENVKVRALVGLCKCGTAGGDDVSKATMEKGAVISLAKACKKFLLDSNKYSVDVRRFACEGLSYLSLDADVKEWIVDDSLLLQALLVLAKSAGALCVNTLASIFVNLTNAYEKPTVEEEMVKLARFAKHHVPETHPKDTEEYIEKRVRALVEKGAVTACIAVSNTESKNALELLARVVLAFSEVEDLRGRVVAEGGTKLCQRLCKEATLVGKIKALHAIAKLG